VLLGYSVHWAAPPTFGSIRLAIFSLRFVLEAPQSKFTQFDSVRLGLAHLSKKTAGFHDFRRIPHEEFFLGAVPELEDSIRISEETSPEAPSVDGDGARLTLG
jgi:hypothetical protein